MRRHAVNDIDSVEPTEDCQHLQVLYQFPEQLTYALLRLHCAFRRGTWPSHP